MGLGAGVGGEAGADGGRGFDISWGIPEVFGVKGGLGWENCKDPFPRERCPDGMRSGGGFTREFISPWES